MGSLDNIASTLFSASPEFMSNLQQRAQLHGGAGGMEINPMQAQMVNSMLMPAADIIPWPIGKELASTISDAAQRNLSPGKVIQMPARGAEAELEQGLSSLGILPDSAKPEWMSTWPQNIRDQVYEQSTVPHELGYPHLAEQGKRLAERIHSAIPRMMKEPKVFDQMMREADRYSEQLSKIPDLDRWRTLFTDPENPGAGPTMRNWYSDYPE